LYSDLEQTRAAGRDDIISMIEQVIRVSADRGDVVIVGRGAQVILAGRPDTLHVRLVAPLSFRCRRVAAREGMGLAEATELVRRVDRDRERYLRQYYQVNWGDSTLYHLTLNTERTGVELAARLIAGTVEQGLWADQEKEEAFLPSYASLELTEAEG
jgi:cytidylate kinase